MVNFLFSLYIWTSLLSLGIISIWEDLIGSLDKFAILIGNKTSFSGLRHILLSTKGINDISYSFLNNLEKKLLVGTLKE